MLKHNAPYILALRQVRVFLGTKLSILQLNFKAYSFWHWVSLIQTYFFVHINQVKFQNNFVKQVQQK